MNGWILTAGASAPEIERGISEASKHGIQIERVDPKEVDLLVDPKATVIHLRGQPVDLPDFAVAAFFEDFDLHNLAVLEQLEALGTLCLNTASTIFLSANKLRTHLRLAQAGIPTPKTLLLHPASTVDDLRRHFELPLVVKPIDGSKGEGVELIRTDEALEAFLQTALAKSGLSTWVAQEYIQASHGKDLRILVIDRKPVFAMLREGKAGTFTSNYSTGGKVSAWTMDDALKALAQKVIDATGLNMGGIDVLLGDDGYQVCEINSMPGFQGIEQCSDINVPMALFRSIGLQLAGKRKSPFQMRAFLAKRPQSKSLCEHLALTTGADTLQNFVGLCMDPKSTQQQVLDNILRLNANCERGKQLGFSSIQSIEEFRQRVPLSEWPDYAEAAKVMEGGAQDQLFAGATPYFILTSGSTGQPKHLPESELGALAKSLTGRLRTTALVSTQPNLLQGYFLPLSNRPSFGQTEAGIPIGSASGLTLSAVPEAIRKRMAFPLECYSVTKQADFDLISLCFALARDIRAIIGNNATRAEQLFELASEQADVLIESIASGKLPANIKLEDSLRQAMEAELQAQPERADELRKLRDQGDFIPRHYWPRLKLFSCWLSGSVGRFADSVRNYLPEDCVLFDCGYGASEGKFNVPLRPERASGALAIHAGFYEFIPEDGGEPLLAHELEDQQRYELIITNFSGLNRYRIHDLVRVDGFTGRTPNIVFETKSGEVANIAGEKIAPRTVIDAFESLPKALREPVHHYALLEGEDDHHWLCVEARAGNQEVDVAALAAQFNAAMESQSMVYKVFRDQNQIGPCKGILCRSGWRDALYAERIRPGQSSAQIKLPVILRKPLNESFILKREAHTI